MEEKYKKLFGLYADSRSVFQWTVEKIGADGFDHRVIYDCLSQKNPDVLDGARRILLTHFNETLSTHTIQSFLDVSGDSFVQDIANRLIEKRRVKAKQLDIVADEIVAMFS